MSDSAPRNAPSPPVAEVRRYWEAHPLAGFESPVPVGSVEFFDWHDRVRRADVEAYAMHTYEFDRHRGERVLDVGCGVGWLVEHYARGGARVVGVDLTRRGVDLTRRRLALRGLQGAVVQASAEQLPFRSGAFDFVVSAGVLHHTPDTSGAAREACRVLRPLGRGMISLYFRNLFMSPLVWPVTRLMVRLLFSRVPGRGGLASAAHVDEFARMYDGDENPVGKAFSRNAAIALLAPMRIEAAEVHYFPRRFVPFRFLVPGWLHRLLDRVAGTMIYVRFAKP